MGLEASLRFGAVREVRFRLSMRGENGNACGFESTNHGNETVKDNVHSLHTDDARSIIADEGYIQDL